MKTKFKDFLLYSMACIGAVSLFLSAYQPEQTTSAIPESHVWEIKTEIGSKLHGFLYNKKTGEVIYLNSSNYFSRVPARN